MSVIGPGGGARVINRTLATLCVICAVCGSAGASAASNDAQLVTREVRSGFQAQLNKTAKQEQKQYPGVRFTVTGLSCVQVKTSENYKCLAYYSLRYKSDEIKYKDVIDAQVSGNKVSWQAHGGIPIK